MTLRNFVEAINGNFSLYVIGKDKEFSECVDVDYRVGFDGFRKSLNRAYEVADRTDLKLVSVQFILGNIVICVEEV